MDIPRYQEIRFTDIAFDYDPYSPRVGTPRGNFGFVVFGWWRGIRVAVKILPSNGPGFEAAFHRECSILQTVRQAIDGNIDGSRHLLVVYGYGTEVRAPPCQSVHFIVMEHLSGATLKDIMASGQLALDVLLRAAHQLAGGLAALAAEQIVHADVHCGNVMFRSAGGELVLVDYGLSRIFNRGPNVLLYPGQRRGFEYLVAPELLDDTHMNTSATDV